MMLVDKDVHHAYSHTLGDAFARANLYDLVEVTCDVAKGVCSAVVVGSMVNTLEAIEDQTNVPGAAAEDTFYLVHPVGQAVGQAVDTYELFDLFTEMIAREAYHRSPSLRQLLTCEECWVRWMRSLH